MADRDERHGDHAGGTLWRGQPPQGRVIRKTPFTAEDEARHRQEFVAGTVLPAAVGVAVANDGPDPVPMDALFLLYVHEDERTFGAAPQLRDAFAMLDEMGAVELSTQVPVGVGWAGMGGHDPLMKLKMDFLGPRPGKGMVELVLPAVQYASVWHRIVGGGLIGITSQQRMDGAMRGEGASFADAMEACILLPVGSSPIIEQFIDAYSWPRH